jgi:hypothetical protein
LPGRWLLILSLLWSVFWSGLAPAAEIVDAIGSTR